MKIEPQEQVSLVCWNDLTDEQKELFFELEPDWTDKVCLFIFEDELYSVYEAYTIDHVPGYHGAIVTGLGFNILLCWIEENVSLFAARATDV